MALVQLVPQLCYIMAYQRCYIDIQTLFSFHSIANLLNTSAWMKTLERQTSSILAWSPETDGLFSILLEIFFPSLHHLYFFRNTYLHFWSLESHRNEYYSPYTRPLVGMWGYIHIILYFIFNPTYFPKILNFIVTFASDICLYWTMNARFSASWLDSPLKWDINLVCKCKKSCKHFLHSLIIVVLV